jgi:hypothetical protein
VEAPKVEAKVEVKAPKVDVDVKEPKAKGGIDIHAPKIGFGLGGKKHSGSSSSSSSSDSDGKKKKLEVDVKVPVVAAKVEAPVVESYGADHHSLVLADRLVSGNGPSYQVKAPSFSAKAQASDSPVLPKVFF